MKKIIATLFIIIMVAVSSCSNNKTGYTDISKNPEPVSDSNDENAESEEKIVISIASSGNDNGTLIGKVSKKYYEDIKKSSGGKLEVKFFDNGQLGGDAEILDGVRLGSIDIHVGSPSALINLIPELAILDISGLYSDAETCNEVLNGKFFNILQKYYNEKGFQLLAVNANSFRQIISNIPIKNVSDLNGLKIRTMENDYQSAYWKELGAIPIKLSFGEMYIALQQGIVDSAEGTLSTNIPMKMAELENYLVITNHNPNIRTVTMNKEKWDSLSKANKRYLMDMFDGIAYEVIKDQAADDEKLIQLCKDRYNMEVIIPDQSLKDAIRSSSKNVIDLMKQNINPEYVDEYLSAVREVEMCNN